MIKLIVDFFPHFEIQLNLQKYASLEKKAKTAQSPLKAE